MAENKEKLLYRFRYKNGMVSKGGFKTFEVAIKHFNKCKYSEWYGSLYSDLLDVVPWDYKPS
jgi:hypothetical protein